MVKPFICPYCGTNDYTIILTGCNIQGAIVHECYMYDDEARDYIFSGSMVMESQASENKNAIAICTACEKDVSKAVGAYEQSHEEADSGKGQS